MSQQGSERYLLIYKPASSNGNPCYLRCQTSFANHFTYRKEEALVLSLERAKAIVEQGWAYTMESVAPKATEVAR